jgi:hypothetical protein
MGLGCAKSCTECRTGTWAVGRSRGSSAFFKEKAVVAGERFKRIGV